MIQGAMHCRWSHLIANSSMTQQAVQELKQQLQAIRAFPVAGQQWASLSDGLMVNDDSNLAHLFDGVKGVVLLSLPADPNRSVCLTVFTAYVIVATHALLASSWMTAVTACAHMVHVAHSQQELCQQLGLHEKL